MCRRARDDAPAQAVDTALREVDGPVNAAIRSDQVLLFHYAIKSREDYAAKMARGSAMGNHKTWAFFDKVDAACTERCPQALELCRARNVSWCL